MNLIKKAQRERIYARAAELIRHDDPKRGWYVTNREDVIVSLMREFGISEDRARRAVSVASMYYNTRLARARRYA